MSKIFLIIFFLFSNDFVILFSFDYVFWNFFAQLFFKYSFHDSLKIFVYDHEFWNRQRFFRSKLFFLIGSKWITEITECIFMKFEKFNSYVKRSIFFLIANESNFLIVKKLNFEKWYSTCLCFIIFMNIFSCRSKGRCFLFQKTIIRACAMRIASITSFYICFLFFKNFIFLSNDFLRRIFIKKSRNFIS